MSNLTTRRQHRCWLMTLPKNEVLYFWDSIKCNLSQKISKNLEKRSKRILHPNSTRKCYETFVNTACVCKGKNSGRQSISVETIVLFWQACQRGRRKSACRVVVTCMYHSSVWGKSEIDKIWPISIATHNTIWQGETLCGLFLSKTNQMH